MTDNCHFLRFLLSWNAHLLTLLLVWNLYKSISELQDATDCDCPDDQAQDYPNEDDNEIIQELGGLEEACPDLSGQIIGGRASSINRHPYQVSMVMNGNSFCGGFIISRNYVLTAAHCVQK